MVYRVIQWATGGVGQAAVRAVVAHPELELVGCRVYGENKAGRDVGEIVGIESLGVTATTDTEELLRLDADCVVYAPLVADKKEVAALLESGKNVVTPLGWFLPGERDARLEATARTAGVTLHGTGLDPGGITDLIPMVFSSLTSQVTFVRAEEFSDIRSYNAPDVVRSIMQFGATPEQAMTGPMLGLLTGGFTQSLRMIVQSMGFDAEAEILPNLQVAVATAPIDSPIGPIEPGRVAAQRFQWDAVVGGEVIARVAVNWLMGEENLDPPWELGSAGERFEMELQGDPSISVIIKGLQPETPEEGLVRNPGIVATANHLVNSVPYVCAAEPGIKSYLDLPLMTGRAHRKVAGGG
ncbi:dihydrodipicolinate reductase [Aldersonia sp. NBC_00410]|uniref:NAD(P)H-dependent amine dehydrogenase family protein n=1 Tax=Aldersonia sp. NBC_00410 TaxID=2975954 RepID=UPI002252E2B5|nr:dihydrodipicolinate reductase [Aldersonia sp. NBC_00410]MCX5042975.1 dihydrodipicolinate reductase [Aldersonia sp. NBC_00410]